MRKMTTPVDRADQIQPFSDDQCQALLAASRQTTNPLRDVSIVCVLLDTGVRVSEFCALKVGDVSLDRLELTVRYGKGGKARHIPISRDTRKVLFQYLAERRAEEDEPLFQCERGANASGGLRKDGVGSLVTRLCNAAKITGVRCSPHTFRHTFAIMFLRGTPGQPGGNVFSLKTMLGHTALTQTMRYVALADADLQNQHLQFSPVARLKSLKGREGK